jgi:hypothetical protein
MGEKKDKSQEMLRKQLEDMLLGGEQIDEASLNDKPIANDEGQGPLAKVQHPSTRSMDFYAIKEETEVESRKLLKGVIDFYLDAKIIKKNEYIKYKKSVDEMALSNIMFSLKTMQHAIIKIMEEIDMGNTHPRLFEVLGQLQGQLMSSVKHQAAFAITMENGYKQIKDDHDRIEYQKSLDKGGNEEDEKGITDGEPLKIRGTKGLMLSIKTRLENEEEKEPETKARLTDPHNRPENPMSNGKNVEDDFEEDQFEIDDDMF